MRDEKRIIESVLSGDTEMYRHLVERYHERIFILVRGFVHQIEDAEDVTQETFLQAFVSLGSFNGKSEFSTWLYRIGINRAYTFLRKRKKRSISEIYTEKINALAELIHGSRAENPQTILSGKQTEEIIYQEIDHLPQNQKTAFILSRFDELSNKEIADIMSLSVHAVESLLQRAKRQLKIKLIPIINEHEF
ncbi:MAG: RNA polymerase sigma factor [Bacteroidales bacterium]|jgi:RNA polymerase sigma-70 factor (ECF subfamily)|nr:RNA polymerase sigma factor [Bacteroidales bacterium]